MTTDLPVKCDCGTVAGTAAGISQARGNHLICYCDDCQSFAHFLHRAGDVLDPHGGTDIFQTTAGRISFEAGAERLACIRLTRDGPLRWYADCCRTPIANTLASPAIPFVGLIHSCIGEPAAGGSLAQALGPVRAGIHGRYARGDTAGLEAHDKAPVSLLLRVGTMLLAARLRGEHRRSAFFDSASGKPVATPHVLSADELREVEARRDRP